MSVKPRSHELLARNRDILERSLNGRFITEATESSLAPQHFARYLAIEEQFVKTAVRVSAFTLFTEPNWDSVAHHAATIEDLLGEQLTYFHDVRARHNAAPADIGRAIELSSGLSTYVLGSVSSTGYAGAIVNMFAAETLYLEWCSRAAASRALNPVLDLDAWIALHVSPAFRKQVGVLGAFVEALPETTAEGGGSDEHLDAWFTAMLGAEDNFHDAIYFDGA